MAKGGLKFLRGAVADYVNYFLGEDGRGCADHGYYGAGQRWSVTGPGAGGLEVVGEWTPNQYGTWLSGADPVTSEKRGRAVFDGALKGGVRGYEYSVNIPKSASIAAALDPELGNVLVAAQERAALAGLQVVRSRAQTRLTRHGVTRMVGVDALEVAIFSHEGSREGDPHQHLHVQVGSKVFVDGQWASLAGRSMTALLREWQATVAAAMATDAQWVAACAAKGLTVIEGGGIAQISADIEQLFSTRHVAIVAKTAELIDDFHTVNGRRPNARELVWIDQKAWDLTRPKKGEKALLSIEQMNELLHGAGQHRLVDMLSTNSAGPVAGTGSGSVTGFDLEAAVQAGLDLAAQREVLRDEDLRILAALGISAHGGACTDVTEAIANVAVRIRAACTAVDMPGSATAWVPSEVLASAERIHADLAHMREVAAVQLESSLIDISGLSPGQAVAALAIGSGLPVVVEGPAGTGKTTALRRALDARNAAGLRTIAVAPSAAAVQQLGEGWTAASTAHALLVRGGWSFDDAGRWQQATDVELDADLLNAALIVDEAAMLDLHTMAALATHARAHGARMSLVGDDRQLSPVGVAGGFTLAARTSEPIRLIEAQRFLDPNHARLASGFRSSAEVELVINELLAAGIVHMHDTDEDASIALAQIATRDREAIVMVADNETAASINRLVHTERASRGEVVNTVTGLGRQREDIGIGDLVQTRRNDNQAGIFNRQRWIVEAIHSDGSMDVSRADRATIRKTLDAHYVTEHVHRADAVTVHAAQGATATHAHAFLDATWTREQAYVALTRGKHTNVFHVVAGSEADVREVLASVLYSSDRARAQALTDIVLQRNAEAVEELVPSMVGKLVGTFTRASTDSWQRVTNWVTPSQGLQNEAHPHKQALEPPQL